MNTTNKIAAWLLGLALALGGLTFLYQAQGANLAGPQGLCDAKSLYTMAGDAERTGDQMWADMLRQWAAKCEALQAGEPLPSATQSTSPSPSATKASTAPAKNDKATGIEEFLANRPANTKTSTNAFGPKRAVLPSLDDKKMEKLTAAEAKAELIYVVEKVDRMQTADKALDLGIVAKNGDKNQVNDLTKRFVKDRAYWEEVRVQVADRIRELTPSIVTEKARTVVGMSYSTPGKVPQIAKTRVSFGYATKWLILSDENGKAVAKYRLACHFQHGGDYMRQVPVAPRGTTVTPEGETEVLVNACRLVNDQWVRVYGVVRQPGDRKLNAPECNPSPTPSETPSTTPTPTPTPSETTTPTPTPSCREKECQTAPPAPTNRPKPTSSPTRSPETTAPATPTQPASTATPRVTAPGATPKPTKSTKPTPTVEPTATATACVDPDTGKAC